MILIEATIKYKGYDPRDLKPKSTLRICCSCDMCGRVRWVAKQSYRDLCKVCCQIGIQLGEKNAMWGKSQNGSNNPNWKGGITTKVCEQCGSEFGVYPYRNAKFCSQQCMGKWQSENLSGENSSQWKGGFIPPDRSHVLPIKDCNCLNKRFKESAGHHLNKDTVIFIPKELHNHIRHNLKNNKNMHIINILACQFINGGL